MRKGIKVFVIIGVLILVALTISNTTLANTYINENDTSTIWSIENGNIDDSWGGPGTEPPENVSSDPWEYFVLFFMFVTALGMITARFDKKYENSKEVIQKRWIYRLSFSMVFVALWSITIGKDISIGLLFSTVAIILPFIERKNMGKQVWHYYISFAFIANGWLILFYNGNFDFTALFIILAIMVLFGGFYLKDHNLVDDE